MSAEELLRSNELAALNGDRIVSHVSGRPGKKKRGKAKKASAMFFATGIILVFMVFFSSGTLVPAAISERLVEETDVQSADGVESKLAVFQYALVTGDVPLNTVRKLAENGVLVGRMVDGKFDEGVNGGNLVLSMNGKIITAENFMDAVLADARLYEIFNKATYSPAAYYYDDAAREVFKSLGTNRNNYTASEDFEETLERLIGKGNNIGVDNIELVEKKNDKGEIYYEYEALGDEAKATVADSFVAAVSSKNRATNETLATLNAADTLNTADSIAKEQKSSSLFLTYMEPISKMKAGYGNESKINEVMNSMSTVVKQEVMDIDTGTTVTVEGSMLEAPSLYAVLSGEKLDVSATKNYSSDRVLKIVENKVGTKAGNETLLGTVASVAGKIRGSIGRNLTGKQSASANTLSAVTPIIKSSLIDNDFSTLDGIIGGEMLVEGAVNVGKALARASGATAGDDAAIKEYAKLNNTILALNAEVDRMNRSPFDITSKNTFLGSIVYKLAISARSSNLFKTVAGMIRSIAPTTFADDGETGYLTNFGDCETLGVIGAAGSATCATIATFDTSTLNNIFNDAGFKAFVEANTILEDGVRKIKNNSDLADFIKYNNKRVTPDGVMDGGILKALQSGSSTSFLGDILTMVKTFLGATEHEKRIASGAAFVNSTSNPDWNIYKYAQRYVSLARATESLRKYDGEETAYSNLKYFEGTENPVVAFLRDYYNIASN